MASPSAPSVSPVTRATSSTDRRRQRSARLVVAVLLLALAAVLVVATALTRTWLLVTVAAGVAVVLGAAAVRITHSELLDTRRAAAADRAAQARDYLAMTQARITEHAGFVDTMQAAVTAREQSLRELEDALVAAQRRAALATRGRTEQQRRALAAERERDTLATHLDRSETTAAEAIVRVAELEQEIDVLRAELASVTAAWRSAQARAAS